MDLVLQCTEEKAVNAVGVCGNVEAWTNRIREASTNFYRTIGQQAAELEIKPGGSWRRDGDKAQLHTALLEALGARTCYA